MDDEDIGYGGTLRGEHALRLFDKMLLAGLVPRPRDIHWGPSRV